MIFILLLILGFLEFRVFGFVAGHLGFSAMLLAALATTLMGSWVLRQAVGRGQAAMQQQQLRGGDPGLALEGVLAWLLGGLLLLVPGFLSDLLGISLLLPPTRLLWSRLLRTRLRRALQGGGLSLGPQAGIWDLTAAFGGAGRPRTGGTQPGAPRGSEKVVDADFEVLE